MRPILGSVAHERLDAYYVKHPRVSVQNTSFLVRVLDAPIGVLLVHEQVTSSHVNLSDHVVLAYFIFIIDLNGKLVVKSSELGKSNLKLRPDRVEVVLHHRALVDHLIFLRPDHKVGIW